MNQSETNAAATPATASRVRIAAQRRAACRPCLGALARRRLRRAVGAQVGNDPGQVDDEQAHRADGRDRLDVMAGGVVGGEREPEQHDDEHRDLQQRRRVPGQALGEAHHPVRRAARPDHDHEAEHEQAVGEDRADDRRLGDHQLALLQGEDHDEQLRQVAERRLQHPGDGRAEALAELLGREGHDPGEAGERDGRQREARNRRPGRVVGDARQRREGRDRAQGGALEAGQCAQWLSRTLSTRPYSSACSAVKKRSRSMSARTSSVGLPVCSA